MKHLKGKRFNFVIAALWIAAAIIWATSLVGPTMTLVLVVMDAFMAGFFFTMGLK